MSYVSRIDNGEEIKIHYNVIGSGEPIVFHHGNGNSLQDWYTLGYVDELSKDYQLILIDSRGYGKSSKPHDPKSYSIKSRADDTISVLDELKIDKAHCLGGSFGASTCMFLAKYYPKRFKSYILATPYFTQLNDNAKIALQSGIEAYLEALEIRHKTKVDNELVRQAFLNNDPKALLASNSSEWYDVNEYIKYINVAVLMYCGEKEPIVTDLETLSKKIPQSQLHILPGVDHKTAYWDSKLVVPLIRKFVDGI